METPMADKTQQHHEMIVQHAVAADADEWLCPTCGRRFVMRRPPNYEKVVLDPGDERAGHVGGTGGVGIGPIEVTAWSGEDAWRRWLAENGIDWDGPAA
jgi:hypothetical protein